MPIKITQKYDRIQPVSFITKARAKFITLADKVANAAPFAVKSEDPMAGQYIQAIILPNGQKIEDLEQIYDPELIKTLKWDKAEKGETLTKYVQADVEAFDPDTLTTVPIGETGGQMIVGDLTQAAKADMIEYGPGAGRGAVTPVPGQNTWGKTGYWDRAADGNVPRYAVPETFSETVQQKISAMTGAIKGAVELETDPKKRRTQCVNAVKAFQDWLSGALETMGADTEKADLNNQIMTLVKNSLPGVNNDNSIAQKSDNGGVDKMDANEIKGLVANTLKESVPGMISQALKADKEAAETLAAEEAKKAEYEALKKDIADLKAQLEEAKKSQDGEAAKTDDPEKLKEEITALKSELAGVLNKFQAIESSPLVAPSQGENGQAHKSEPNPDDVFNDMAGPIN